MDGDQQVTRQDDDEVTKQPAPLRMVRLTASSLLGFWVALMPAAFGGSEASAKHPAKHPAQAVALRVPGSAGVRLAGARTQAATPAVAAAQVASAQVAAPRTLGVPAVGRMALEKAEAAAKRQLAANAERLEAVSRSISTRSGIQAFVPWSASSQDAASPTSSARYSSGSSTSSSSWTSSSGPSGRSASTSTPDEAASAPMRVPAGLDPRAAAAVRAAYAQLGTPYVWGGTGQGGFDCSGLTQHVWRTAGVTIPRTSSEQARSGTRVRLSDIKPGDLVVYYGSQSHVGIYVGGGKIIHAPHSGTSVQIGSVNDMPVSAVVRY